MRNSLASWSYCCSINKPSVVDSSVRKAAVLKVATSHKVTSSTNLHIKKNKYRLTETKSESNVIFCHSLIKTIDNLTSSLLSGWPTLIWFMTVLLVCSLSHTFLAAGGIESGCDGILLYCFWTALNKLCLSKCVVKIYKTLYWIKFWKK